ncbi:MAG TPA: hypothetical protein VFW83_03400 [Bryobacteraceae bacterium]|nr:hypothetical protein [Bryobacteraceae bacterium]
MHVGVERRDSDWLFSVSDNGIGIDSRYFERIFGIFKRLHGKQIPGTGIGPPSVVKLWSVTEAGSG